MTISTKKTQMLVDDRDAEALTSKAGDTFEGVSGFKYPASIFTLTAHWMLKLALVASGSRAFACLRQANICSSKALWLSTQIQTYQLVVMSVLLYVGETWTVLDRHIGCLSAVLMSHLWRLEDNPCAQLESLASMVLLVLLVCLGARHVLSAN